MPLLIQSFQTHSSSTVPGSGDIGVTEINTSPVLIELMSRFEQGDKQLKDKGTYRELKARAADPDCWSVIMEGFLEEVTFHTEPRGPI